LAKYPNGIAWYSLDSILIALFIFYFVGFVTTFLLSTALATCLDCPIFSPNCSHPLS